MTALGRGEARPSLRDHRVDLYKPPDFIGDVVLERARMTPNVVQRGDGLTLLRSLPDGCAERRRRSELPPLLEFGGADACCAWSEAVIRAVVDFDWDALERREATA